MYPRVEDRSIFFTKCPGWGAVDFWIHVGFLDFMKNIDMSSTSGYMGAKYFQEFGPRFFDMSSASGYMGAKYFQEVGP